MIRSEHLHLLKRRFEVCKHNMYFIIVSLCVDVEYGLPICVFMLTHLQRGGKMGPGRMTLKEFVAFFQDHFADQYMVLYT